MTDRTLPETIDRIKAVIPAEQERLLAALDSVRESAVCAAPGAIWRLWYDVFDLLADEFDRWQMPPEWLDSAMTTLGGAEWRA